MDIDSTLPEPHSRLPAEIMAQIVEDYFAFRNAEVKAHRDELDHHGIIPSAGRREFRCLEKPPDWLCRYDNP